MLKALQILKILKKEKFRFERTGTDIKSISINNQSLTLAIKELEALQLNLYSKKCEDISNMFKDGTNENITFKKLASALNNRSCENCKHNIDTSKLSDEEYLSLIGKCTRCKHYYNDNWEPK